MYRSWPGFIILLVFIGISATARAEFIVSSAIIEFTGDGPRQQDIELISRAKDNDYIVSEVSEILNPGAANESRRLIEDPAEAGLLVTPDKTILVAGSRKVLRFVLLKSPDEREHIYRVSVKPVIKGVQNNAKMGLKILVGYEVLVIVRPAAMQPFYNAHRAGKVFSVTNTGNTNILFQNGKQCVQVNDCKLAQVMRVYPGQTDTVTLPLDRAVTYSIWNGKDTIEKRLD
jgi:P pilus assembly chaperone PapD